MKHHLANARFKLGVTTTAQLVWILAPRLPEAEGTLEPRQIGEAFCQITQTTPTRGRPGVL